MAARGSAKGNLPFILWRDWGAASNGLDSPPECPKLRHMTFTQLHQPFPEQVSFHRTELSVIMSLYGRMVAAGEWRDYGISSLRDFAVFSIFKRTAENPIYKIEKRPKLRMKQGQYALVGIDGQVLKRGNDLKSVLRVLERKLIRIVD